MGKRLSRLALLQVVLAMAVALVLLAGDQAAQAQIPPPRAVVDCGTLLGSGRVVLYVNGSAYAVDIDCKGERI